MLFILIVGLISGLAYKSKITKASKADEIDEDYYRDNPAYDLDNPAYKLEFPRVSLQAQPQQIT